MTHRQALQVLPDASVYDSVKGIKSNHLYYTAPAESWEVTVAFNFISELIVETL
jgi:hypothetical protein